MRCTAASTAAYPVTCGRCSGWSGRSCMRNGWRSPIRGTRVGWNSAYRCRPIFRPCSMTYPYGRPMNKPVVPHQIRKVFTGRIFSVNLESVTLPRGERLEAEVIRHPGSVVLIPLTATGEIVLVRQYRHAIGRWAWELPAGSLKPGEDPEAA